MKKTNYLLSILILFTISCNKDKLNPTIVINNPIITIEGLKSDKEIKINGVVSDDICLDSLYIGIINKNTKKILFEATPNVKNLKTFDFNESWTPSFSQDTYIQLRIYTIDQDNKAASTGGDFKIVK